MAPTLGKRKREAYKSTQRTGEESEDSLQGEDDDAQAVFKRHFEAHFQPLPTAKQSVTVTQLDRKIEGEDENEDEKDWDGFSEPDESEQIEVIEHSTIQSHLTMSKHELREFMSSKPPADVSMAIPRLTSTKGDIEDDVTEAANLKKDLALQRLLAESHLLDSSSSPSLSGTNRHKAMDLRLQSLGSKTSIFKQSKMPVSHRRGIIAKQSEREDKRRTEARENGIILEKFKAAGKRQSEGKRDRGVGAPGVGKFSGGILRLSKKDVFDIEGPRGKLGGRGGRGMRGGRGNSGKRGSRG